MTVDLDAPAKPSALGTLIGVSERKVQEMVERGMLTQYATLGRWLLEYCAHMREQAAGRLAHNELGLTSERARLAKEQADRLELRNREARRELAPVALIEEVLAKAGSEVAGILESIPGAVRRRDPSLSVQALAWIEEEIARARNRAAAVRLADLDLTPPDDEDDRVLEDDPLRLTGEGADGL